jgi:hypothetical protein
MKLSRLLLVAVALGVALPARCSGGRRETSAVTGRATTRQTSCGRAARVRIASLGRSKSSEGLTCH